MNASSPVPAGLAASLAELPPTTPMVLLLRHADREAIPRGKAGNDVGLVPVGEARCGALRALLAPRGGIGWALSSPLRRCVDTARLLGAEPEPSHLLGHPGPFVVDRAEGGRVFGGLGTEHVVRRQLAGHAWPFMRPPGAGEALLLGLVEELLRTRTGTGVLVSHDAIVMPLVTAVGGDVFDGRWLSPLDGLVFTHDEQGHLRAWWRGVPHEVRA